MSGSVSAVRSTSSTAPTRCGCRSTTRVRASRGCSARSRRPVARGPTARRSPPGCPSRWCSRRTRPTGRSRRPARSRPRPTRDGSTRPRVVTSQGVATTVTVPGGTSVKPPSVTTTGRVATSPSHSPRIGHAHVHGRAGRDPGGRPTLRQGLEHELRGVPHLRCGLPRRQRHVRVQPQAGGVLDRLDRPSSSRVRPPTWSRAISGSTWSTGPGTCTATSTPSLRCAKTPGTAS